MVDRKYVGRFVDEKRRSSLHRGGYGLSSSCSYSSSCCLIRVFVGVGKRGTSKEFPILYSIVDMDHVGRRRELKFFDVEKLWLMAGEIHRYFFGVT